MAATEFVGDNLYAGASFEFPCTTVTTPSRPLSSVWTLARSVSSAGVVGGAVSANDGACAPITAAAVRTAAKTMKRDQRDINALSRGSVAQRSRVRASSQQNGDHALGIPLVLAGSLSRQMPTDRSRPAVPPWCHGAERRARCDCELRASGRCCPDGTRRL